MYHVLIVDSDPMARKLTELLITSGNQYRLVPSLGSVTMAEHYCAETSVDLVLLDMMTAMDTGSPESIWVNRT